MIPFFNKSEKPGDDELVLVEYIKPDRSPLACYNIGDIAGWPRPIAEKLIAQGFAILHDAGKGLGKVNPDLIKHLPEAWETNDWGAFHAAQKKG
jgi:hypothetical protein